MFGCICLELRLLSLFIALILVKYLLVLACKTCSNCDEVTGECKCPPGTFGDKCDKCKPGTYGYDPVVGCGSCKCDPFGTKNGNQTCDVVTGQCPCRDNFGGRKCSECRAGFYGKPACKKCFCNEAGITEKKCDSDNGRCLCKVWNKICDAFDVFYAKFRSFIMFLGIKTFNDPRKVGFVSFGRCLKRIKKT